MPDSSPNSEHVHEIREALRCAAAGDPSQVNLALDALISLQEQLETYQRALEAIAEPYDDNNHVTHCANQRRIARRALSNPAKERD